MKAMLELMWAMPHLPKPWVAWLALLISLNLAGGFYYVGSLEGLLAVAAISGGVIVMTVIYKAKGFVRLLGLGHIFWVPLVPWLWMRYADAPVDSGFRIWLAAVMLVNTVSLIIDAVDVVRYARGERAPTIALPE